MSVLLRFQAPERPSSFDAETGAFQAILATNVRLDRGDHIEVLDLDAIGAGGWPESLPLQADHRREVAQTIGRLQNLRLETLPTGVRALVADGRLTVGGPQYAAIAANLSAGHQRGVSISMDGIRVNQTRDPATGKNVRTVQHGRPVEASFVVDPADPLSTIRSNTMSESATAPERTETTLNEDTTTDTRRGLTADQFAIFARAAGFADTAIDAVRDADASDEIKFQMLQRAASTSQPIVRTAGGHNDNSLDNPSVLRTALTEGFDTLIRGATLEGRSAALIGEGDASIARRLLRASGTNTAGMSDETVKRNAAATSDYAIIAGSTVNLVMRREFEAVRSPVAELFGRETVATFNPEARALVDWTTLAMAPKLENGEYKSSYVDESGEEIFVTVRGGVTAISWELSINAVGRLGNMAQKLGRRYAADQADQQVSFLEQKDGAGKKMADGQAVFHASRGNIEGFAPATATAIPQLFSLRSKMARRKGAGNVMIGDYPTHWLVHPDFEETALRLLASITASSVADVNPLAGKLTIVVEPRLSRPDRSWLVVQPSKMDGAVSVFLRSHEAPFTDTRQNWNTDALEFKIRHAFGLGWLEWRSWTRLDHAAN